MITTQYCQRLRATALQYTEYRFLLAAGMGKLYQKRTIHHRALGNLALVHHKYVKKQEKIHANLVLVDSKNSRHESRNEIR